MTYDYPAPLYSDDEEEERKNRYPAPRPVAGPPGPPPGYTPISPEEQSQRVAALPAPEPRSDVALASQNAPASPAAAPQAHAGHPQWRDYAPPEPHGWSKFGHFLAGLTGPTDYFFNQLPEQRAQRNYQNASNEYEGNFKDQEEQARTKEVEANTGKINTETQAMGKPKPKEEEWAIDPHHSGANGEPVEIEKNSGRMRVGGSEIPGIKAVAPNGNTKSEKEQLQAALVEAQNKGDKAQAAKLRQQIKDIDPLGEQRVNISVSGQNFRESEALKKDAQPTAATRTMAETAPKVLDLSSRIRKLIEDQKSSLGPASSRWAEFMAGKVGAPNPEFTKLRTDVGLLQTALMRMHVGARGGEMMMQHFRDLIDSSKQDPENLMAALEEIEAYANEVKGGGAPSPTEQTPGAPPAGAEIIDYTHLK